MRIAHYAVAAAACLLAAPTFAQGIFYDIAPRHPRPEQPRGSVRLVLEHHRVSGVLNENVAKLKVTERFRNPAPHPIEGVYLCPIPKGATARGLALIVNGQRMAGEILDAGKAGDVYRDIVRKMRDPALLEHVEDGLLRASVFPVPANGCVDVEIDLDAPIQDVGAGLLELTLPLQAAASSGAQVAIDLSIACDRHLDTIYSPTHQATITRDGEMKARVCFDAKADQSANFRLYFAADSQKGQLRILSHRVAGKDGYFLVMHEPNDDIALGAPRDIVFVLDRSGSMQGEKWTQAVKALRFGIEGLRDTDRLAFVSFATDVRTWRSGLESATADAKKSAVEHLESLKPVGGTNIADALAAALPMLAPSADRLPLVVFITDGVPTVGEVDVNRILGQTTQANAHSARIFAFGVGYDVNTILLDRLAEDSRADSNYVAPSQDLEVPLGAFFAKVAEPAIAGPKLRVEGAGIEVFDVEPSRIPDLFVGDTLRVAGRFRGTGKVKLVLEGTHAGKPVVITREIDFAAETRQNDFLPGQWAARRIGNLLTQIRLHGATKELADEVAALGNEFGIVTPYNSGLVVEDAAFERGRLADSRGLNGAVGGGGGPTTGGGHTGKKVARPAEAKDKDGGVAGPGASGSDGFLLGQGKKAEAGAPAPASGADAVRASNELKKLSKGELPMKEDELATATRKRVGARNFAKTGTTWVDATFTEKMRAEMRVIQSFSDEYFVFAKEHQELAEVLALGDDLIFVIDGKAIRIQPDSGI